MKLCPACKTAYTDGSLKYCLADGTPLEPIADEQPTVVKNGASASMNVVPAVEMTRDVGLPTWVKFAFSAVVLAVLAIAAAGLIGAVLYYGSGRTEKDIAAVKSPTPTPIATIDNEKERLKDELANARKKLDEQKRSNTNTAPFPNDDRVSTGTVNSPGDGFLALRNAPDADVGDRIAKIPHGARVIINNCEKTAAVVAGRTGRWCQVEYHGQTGWVFDAWLDR